MTSSQLSVWGSWLARLAVRDARRCSVHITRHVMYERVMAAVAPLQNARVLSISHSLQLTRLLCSDCEIVEANYPDQNWLALPYESGTFDLVVSDQVLEHVEGSPQQAIDESFRVLRPGGVSVCTTCFANAIHSQPGDFWRFTPDGLRLLHHDQGTVLDSGGWGSRWLPLIEWLGLRYVPVPEARWHPLHRVAHSGRASDPVVVWVVARK